MTLATRHTPSYKQGFARSAGRARYPGLRKGLAGMWLPPLGPSGSTLWDWSGRKSHAGCIGDPDWVMTDKGWAIRLESADGQYVSVPASFSMNTFGALSLWVRLATGGINIWSKANWNGVLGMWLNRYWDRPDDLDLKITKTGTDLRYITGDGPLQEGVWHHIAACYDGPGARVYLDGVKVPQLTQINGSGTVDGISAYPMYIGRTGSTISLDADVAQVLYYDRPLILGEVLQLHRDPYAIVRQRARWFPAATIVEEEEEPATTAGPTSTIVRHRPSYKQGFARSAGQARYPGLRKGLAGLWLPSLGPSGSTLWDWSGRHNRGTLIDMDPGTDWVMTDKGWALDFDGGNDYINVPDSPSVDIVTAPLSIFAWVYPRVNSNSGYIISKNLGSPSDLQYGLYKHPSSNRADIYLEGLLRASSLSNSVPSDAWTFLGFTWNGSGDVQPFINGEQNGATGRYTGALTSRPYLQISSRKDALADRKLFFSGNIAQVAIWSRTLSHSEIHTLYRDPLAIVRQRASVFPAVAAEPGAVAGPYQAAAGVAYVTGAVAGRPWSSGAVTGDVHTSGSVAGMLA